jgi:SAM-dependent methyltransferase
VSTADDATAAPAVSRGSYGELYEDHARATGDDGVGGGDYDVMGEIELDVLRAEGLAPTSTLLDFGCGNGRLAVHAAPYLSEGSYIGTDVAPTFLDHARRRIDARAHTGDVRLLQQHGESFDIASGSVDMVCAFSVFTHMEHEDLYRYLVAFQRLVRPGGKVVISCLPLRLLEAQPIFLAEASLDPVARWQRVRNVVTTEDLVERIAAIADWRVVKWLPGDEGQAVSERGEVRRLGQSIVVLTR